MLTIYLYHRNLAMQKTGNAIFNLPFTVNVHLKVFIAQPSAVFVLYDSKRVILKATVHESYPPEARAKRYSFPFALLCAYLVVR